LTCDTYTYIGGERQNTRGKHTSAKAAGSCQHKRLRFRQRGPVFCLPVDARQRKLRMTILAARPKRAKARVIILAQRLPRVPIPASIPMLAMAAFIPIALVLLVMSVRAFRSVAITAKSTQLHPLWDYRVEKSAVIATLALLSQPMGAHDCSVSRHANFRLVDHHDRSFFYK
jgi:hypothetical protein